VIEFSKNFLKSKDYVLVFALIYFDLKIDKKSQLRSVSREMRDIKNYKDVFNSKNAFTLLEHDNKNYDIDLLSRTKLSYESLYSLFEKKFNILQNYLLKNLTLSRIRESIFFVEASMLFVLKSDKSLRLCVDYRDLNAITLKNRHSLSLIKKTLNRLIDVAYFIKLNLKNAYYRIRIRQENK